jgi:hypothetical protein
MSILKKKSLARQNSLNSLNSVIIPNNVPLSGVLLTTGSMWTTGLTITWSDNNYREYRKQELMNEYDKDPELFSEIIVELRKKKIKQLQEKSKK